MKTITVNEISKKWKRSGNVSVVDGAKAEIIPGSKIRIFGKTERPRGEDKCFDTTFRIGDVAEYDSYNLHYLGTIVKITAKQIWIVPTRETKPRRLSLYNFAWRNYDFNLQRISKFNEEERMCI